MTHIGGLHQEESFGQSKTSIVAAREFRSEPFIPTQAEWSAKNREQILRDARQVSVTTTLFTVPANRTLFITSAAMSCSDPSAANSTNKPTLEIGATRQAILTCVSSSTAQVGQHGGSVTAVAQSFPMPIIANAGEIVRLVTGVNTTVMFQGWLE